MILFSFVPSGVTFAGAGSSSPIRIISDGGVQYLEFFVSTTSSTAGIKYQAFAWQIKVDVNSDGSNNYSGTMPMDELGNVTNVGSQHRVLMKLDTIYTTLGMSSVDKLKSGTIKIDGMFIVKQNGQPVTINGQPATSGWDTSDRIILNDNNIRKYGTKAGILGAPMSLFGVNWSSATQNDLPSFFDISQSYAAVQQNFSVPLTLTVKSTANDHTIDSKSNKRTASAKIYAQTIIDPSINPGYLGNPSNIASVTFTLGGQVKTITSFSSLTIGTDFNFTYTSAQIKDGDTIDYNGMVIVTYKDKYVATGADSTSISYKVNLSTGELVAVINALDEATVGTNVTADGLGTLVPPGATVTNYKWTVEGVEVANGLTKSSIDVTSEVEKTVTIGLEVSDSQGHKDSTTKDIIFKKNVVAPPPVNFPPNVDLSAPNFVMMGEDFNLVAFSSDTEDGAIQPVYSKPSNLIGNLALGDNTVHFNQVGTFSVSAKVTDSGGQEDTDSVSVEVLPPVPLAVITEKGYWKVGHTMTLDASKSLNVSDKYPIDHTKTIWSIKPLGELQAADIFVKKIDDKLTKVTSKKTGDVDVSLTVTNTAGYSNTRKITRTIIADQAPSADFITAKTTYRGDDGQAEIKVVDASTSPDGDTISKRVWTYGFDADNDGDLTNNPWYVWSGTAWEQISYNERYTIASSYNTNVTTVSVNTTKVGMYQFELSIAENHNDRLTEFIDSSFILTDNTANKILSDKYTNVDNIAPVVSVKVDVAGDNNYDIVVVTDYEGADLVNLQNDLNQMKAQMFTQNRDAKIHLVTDKIKSGKQHVVKNFYTYARYVDIDYWMSGRTEVSVQTNTVKNYNNDYQNIHVEYETTQSYNQPTIDFVKGDPVTAIQTSFSTRTEGTYSNGEMSGAEFQIYNPANKLATIVNPRVELNGWYQGMGFCYVYSLNINSWAHRVSNVWTNTGRFQAHDYYFDIYGMDFNKITSLPYQANSKKVFMYFTKADNTNYEVNKKAYSGATLTEPIAKYLVDNQFEIYTVANENVTDWKMANKEFNSDITTQAKSLRELSHSSLVRGKVLSNTNWKASIEHITNKNVSVAKNINVDNNVISIDLGFNANAGDEVNLAILQEFLKLTDHFGNVITTEMINRSITVKSKEDIAELSSFSTSVPVADFALKSNVKIIRASTAGHFAYVIYDEGGQQKIHISKTNSYYMTDAMRKDINMMDFSNIKQIEAGNTWVAMLTKTGQVNYYSNRAVDPNVGLTFPTPQIWTNIKKIAAGPNILLGLTNDNKVIQNGSILKDEARSTYYQNEIIDYSGASYSKLDIGSRNFGQAYIYTKLSVPDSKYNVRYYTWSQPSDSGYYVPQIMQDNMLYNDKAIGVISATTFKYANDYYAVLNNYGSPVAKISIPNKTIDVLVTTGSPPSSIDTLSYFAITTDRELYFPSYIDVNYLSSSNVFPNFKAYLSSLGKVIDYYPVDSKLCVVLEKGTLYIGTSPSSFTVSDSFSLIPLQDVSNIASNILSNGSFVTLKNGITKIASDYVLAYEVQSKQNVKSYYVDQYGYAYFTKDNNFVSVILPQYQSNSYYNFRTLSGQYDDVIYNQPSYFILTLKDGRMTYRGQSQGGDLYDSYKGVVYWTDIKSVLNTRNAIVGFKDNGAEIAYQYGSYNPAYNGYNQFHLKNAKEFITNGAAIYGLSSNGEVWATGQNGLTLQASGVKKMFNLNGTIVYLYTSGDLSQYGENLKYELYDGTVNTNDFITLKLQGKDTLVSVYQSGVSVGYLGEFRALASLDLKIGKTKMILGKHSSTGVAYRYKIFTKEFSSVDDVLKNEMIDTTAWKVVAHGDYIEAPNGCYIGVVEVNAQGRAVGYSISRVKANN